MFDLSTLLTFTVAAFVVIIVPGPMVTIVIANALRFGAGAGLWTVAGSELAHLLLIAVIAFGLDALATSLGAVFEWVRLIGAAYLIWLGVKLLRSGLSSTAEIDADAAPDRSLIARRGGFFAHGFLVGVSNPKTLLFLGAFLPQFIDPTRGDPAMQVLLLGLIFSLVAVLCDSIYAVAAGGAGGWLKRQRRAIECGSGVMMISGGLWMALRGRV